MFEAVADDCLCDAGVCWNCMRLRTRKRMAKAGLL
jgi:hypothetical protein